MRVAAPLGERFRVTISTSSTEPSFLSDVEGVSGVDQDLTGSKISGVQVRSSPR